MLTTTRTLFTCSLSWELRREQRVHGTPTNASANSFPDPRYLYTVEQHSFAFYTKCATSVELVAVVVVVVVVVVVEA